MVKVKNKTERLINLGIINGQMLYFKPGEEKEVEESPEYLDIIDQAEADGFLEILAQEKKLFKKEKSKEDKDK